MLSDAFSHCALARYGPLCTTRQCDACALQCGCNCADLPQRLARLRDGLMLALHGSRPLWRVCDVYFLPLIGNMWCDVAVSGGGPVVVVVVVVVVGGSVLGYLLPVQCLRRSGLLVVSCCCRACVSPPWHGVGLDAHAALVCRTCWDGACRCRHGRIVTWAVAIVPVLVSLAR
jgi:hypothetical protein